MKRTLFFIFKLAMFVMFIISLAVPEMFADPGLITASTFITTSITWGGKETLDYFLRPMFIGKSPLDTQGIRIIPNITSGQKLNYFGAASKLLKAYAKGFSAASGTTYTQRTLTTYRMKAEAADDALDFYQTVFESGLKKDDWNNLDDTFLKNIIIEIYRNAVASDVYRQFWLNDVYKETVTSGLITGTADADYNAFDGMWELLMDNASTTPSDLQIFRHTVTDGAVKEVDTVTMTGTAGTANLVYGGVNYLFTFDTSLTKTNTDALALHAAALLLRGVVMTVSVADVILTSVIPGSPTPVPSVTNLTGNLAGTNADTTANTAPAALASGESEDIMLALHIGADKVLKQLDPSQKVFLVADLVLENYMTYLESLGTERAHLQLENGQTVYTYRGIPILGMGWDIHLGADWPQASGTLHAYPHRVIYTSIDNLVLGIDSANQFTETKMWYNPDQEENRFRSKLVIGVQFVHNKLTAVAY